MYMYDCLKQVFGYLRKPSKDVRYSGAVVVGGYEPYDLRG